MGNNLWTKLNEARLLLQSKDMKKSGKNTYSNYNYFELSDFLTEINAINSSVGICDAISFKDDVATLTLRNAENPEEVEVFTSPMRGASLKGCHEIQNLGAVETYQRRYLYMMAYNIVESDALEPVTGKEKDDKGNKPNNNTSAPTSGKKNDEFITDAQRKRMFGIAGGKTTLVKDVLMKHNITDSSKIKKSEYEAICEEIKEAVSKE